jgi:hypothetical protein
VVAGVVAAIKEVSAAELLSAGTKSTAADDQEDAEFVMQARIYRAPILANRDIWHMTCPRHPKDRDSGYPGTQVATMARLPFSMSYVSG